MLLRARLVDALDDDGRSGERLLHVALGDLQPLEHVVPPVLDLLRPRRGAKIQRRRLGRDHHVDRAGRAPCHFPRGMRHQQHRLVHVAHVSGGEHRLVALDEEDFVRGGNVPVIDDDDLRPVHLGSEADECDATARGGTPDRHPPQRALER